jgi:hypothetical protein
MSKNNSLMILAAIFLWSTTSISLAFNIEDATKEIESASSWTRLSDKQVLTDGDKLTSILEKYVFLKTITAREIVERLEMLYQNKFDSDVAGKIYVFNRLFCNVPEKSNHEKWMFFGGWAGVSIKDNYVNSLFPLTKLDNGKLKLVYSFAGYTGPHYRGLAEFDFLIERFGRRFEEK